MLLTPLNPLIQLKKNVDLEPLMKTSAFLEI